MAFQDLPIIDDNSRNSEKSENRFKEYFNQQNNFIARSDVPDKGCDFDIELITKKNGSSNWRFPVQLKSTTKLKLVDKGSFISFSFETSRLNYLMRRLPPMGLLVVYSTEDNTCYFEYADKIYQRLIQTRTSESWKNNKNVNVKIPKENSLSLSTAKEIHQVFTTRFQNALRMQNAHGDKYDLPTADISGKTKYDFTRTEDIKKFLIEYGPLLLSKYDLGFLYDMLSKIPLSDLSASKELLLAAAIVYSEVGKYSDSIYFSSKLRKNFELNESEDLSLEFSITKNDLHLGHITNDQFIEKLEKLCSEDISLHNKITIQINLTRYKLIEIKAFQNPPVELDKKVQEIFGNIEMLSDDDDQKYLLKVWNCENYAILLNDKLRSSLSNFTLTKELGGDWSLEAKKKAILSFIQPELSLLEMLNNLYKKGLASGEKLLQAAALSTYVNFYIQKQITLLGHKQQSVNIDGEEKVLKTVFNYAFIAYTIYGELNMLKDAHYNLGNAIEILELAKYQVNANVADDLEKLRVGRELLEKEGDIKPYDSVIVKMIANLKGPNSETGDSSLTGVADFSQFDDEQIRNLAIITLKAKNLPENRLTNIINEIKAHKLFQQRCTDKNVIMLLASKMPFFKEHLYEYPVTFVLRNIKSGIESIISSDMDHLLSSWGF